MGSINTDSTTINFNGANIKIATSGKGLIFADGTTLSSNTEIGGGGSSNLAQVVDLGNVTANTLLLENTGRTIVSSGNIESNIITTIIRFQEGSELPDGQGITLESATNNGNTISNVVQFSNGFTVGSNLVVDEIGTNVIDVTGRIVATLFVGDGGLLSNISGGGGGSQTLQQTTDLGNTTSETVQFTNTGTSLVTSGYVGIGTNSPTAPLHIYNEHPDMLYLENTGTLKSSIRLSVSDKPWEFGCRSNGAFYVYDNTNSAYRMLVSAGGNVGIGTISPSSKLHVAGDIHSTTGITVGASSDTTILNAGGIEICKTSGNPLIDFKTTSTDDYDFRISQQSNQLVFTSATSARSFTFDGAYGSFGLHKSSPEGRLHIKQTVDDSGGDLNYYSYAAINIERAASTSKWSIHHTSQQDLRFYYNRNSKALIRDNGTDDTYLNFTGQHRCFNEFSNASNLVGMIVCSKSNKYVNFDFSQSPTINECLPVITLSNMACDKSCFGVISGKEDSGNRTTSSGAITTFLEQESGDNRVFVNSLGEGAIWVSNLNGNLESGDYITTSNISGYGQRQDSEFLANYTVAKITIDCDFNPQMVPKRIIQKDADGKNVLDANGNLILEDSNEMISQYEVKTLDDGAKVAFVGCTYHCG